MSKLKNKTAKEEFNELSFYTLAHLNKTYFVHQHIVDAFTAQTANETTKPIGLTFALVGLYLYIEKNFTGRQVQLAHIKLTEDKKVWPKFKLPLQRGIISVSTVLAVNEGKLRDEKINEWCYSVWDAYIESHTTIDSLVKTELRLD